MKVITNFGRSYENFQIKKGTKVKELLMKLIKDLPYGLLSEDDLDQNIEILLNGKDIHFLPEKLDYELKNGDTLEIYLTPLGGG